MRARAAAGGALPAAGVGRDEDVRAFLPDLGHSGTHGGNCRADLMAGDTRVCDHRVEAAEGSEVGPAKPHLPHMEQHLALAGRVWLRHVNDAAVLRLRDAYRFHKIYSQG